MHASRNLEPVVAVSLDERITKAEALVRDSVEIDAVSTVLSQCEVIHSDF